MKIRLPLFTTLLSLGVRAVLQAGQEPGASAEPTDGAGEPTPDAEE